MAAKSGACSSLAGGYLLTLVAWSWIAIRALGESIITLPKATPAAGHSLLTGLGVSRATAVSRVQITALLYLVLLASASSMKDTRDFQKKDGVYVDKEGVVHWDGEPTSGEEFEERAWLAYYSLKDADRTLYPLKLKNALYDRAWRLTHRRPELNVENCVKLQKRTPKRRYR